MTPNDSLERYLADGLAGMAGTGTPDYLDDILRRSVRTRQRRAWLPLQRSVFPDRAPHERAGWTTRRFQMTPLLRYAAVATIAVAVGLGVAPIISSPSPYLGADPSPSPSQSPNPAMAPAWVTGTIDLAAQCTGPTTTLEGVIEHQRDFRCAPQTWKMSDSRLTGTAVDRWNQDVIPVAGGDMMAIGVGGYDLQNDDGSWQCHYEAALAPYRGDPLFAGSDTETNVCVGAGSYEGLSAILVLDWTKDPVPVRGAIFPGGLPPAT